MKTQSDFPLKDPIISNPDILGGEPVIIGTRIPASLLFELTFRRRYPRRIILMEYPTLTNDKVDKFISLMKQFGYGQTPVQI